MLQALRAVHSAELEDAKEALESAQKELVNEKAALSSTRDLCATLRENSRRQHEELVENAAQQARKIQDLEVCFFDRKAGFLGSVEKRCRLFLISRAVQGTVVELLQQAQNIEVEIISLPRTESLKQPCCRHFVQSMQESLKMLERL